MVLVDRYNDGPAAVCLVKNFGLKRGDCIDCFARLRNIIAVGVSDEDIARSINALIEVKGGISVAATSDEGKAVSEVLPLPIAGLMSDQDGYQVAQDYSRIDALAKSLGSQLTGAYDAFLHGIDSHSCVKAGTRWVMLMSISLNTSHWPNRTTPCSFGRILKMPWIYFSKRSATCLSRYLIFLRTFFDAGH